MTNPIQDVADAVDVLEGALSGLLEACTDPEATDMAELFAETQAARKKLQAIERDIEVECAKAMLSDQALTPHLRVERYRGTTRKAWDHEAWQRDVRNKALRARGLAGAQGVVTADGELAGPEVLHDVLAAVQSAHGAAGPKTGALRELGLDARDYCESSPGDWHVRVIRMADEQETEKEGETDAA